MTGGVKADYTAQDLLNMMPELQDIANIKAKKVMSVMSEDLLAKDWEDMARHIQKEVKAGAKGVVITHGTDTLHYTARCQRAYWPY